MSNKIFGGMILSLVGAMALSLSAIANPKVYNVVNYGAVGNGTTDDSAAIQQAFDAASKLPGSVVLFPAGNYYHTKILKANAIRIIGAPNAILTGVGANQTLALQGNGVAVENLTFSNSSLLQASAPAILVANTNGFHLNALTIDQIGSQTDTVVVKSCSNGNISNITFTSDAGSGVDYAAVITSCNNVTVTQNSVTGGDGFDVSKSEIISIASNTLNTVGTAIHIVNSVSVQAQKNTLSNVVESGIQSKDNTLLNVSGNTINMQSYPKIAINSSTNKQALYFQNILNSQIYSNTDYQVRILENTINQSRQGVEIVGGTSPTITANIMSNIGGEGIIAENCSGTVTILGNALSNCGNKHTFDFGPAVIYVNSASATSIPITKNRYSGSTTFLKYFIDCLQPSPPAQLSGNKTSTMLPSTP